jgi:site-specific DNA recombinase
LDPDALYGLAYYGKKQVTKRQVAEGVGDERHYRQRIKAQVRDREQWFAVPTPDSGLPRELVDTARGAIKDNRCPSRSEHRSYELAGLLRCSRCGYTMGGKTTSGGRSRGRLYFYYRCGGHFRSNNGCDHAKQHRAEEAEAKVWQYVRTLMENPEELRADLERMIEIKRKETRRDPEREAKTWLDRLAKVDRQRARAQDMAIQGLLDYEELRAKLASLEETREAVERELEILKDHEETIAELERGKEAVLQHYAPVAPEALNSLTPEERRHLYKLLQLNALQHPDGRVEVEVSGVSDSGIGSMESTCSSIY